MTTPWPDDLWSFLWDILGEGGHELEQLDKLAAAFSSAISLPLDGYVIGEPVEVVEVWNTDRPRRGLVARCRRPDGSEHVVSIADVRFHADTTAERHVHAYLAWLGVEPPPEVLDRTRRPTQRRHKASDGDLDLSQDVELIVLAPKKRAARCLVLGTRRVITLRSARVWDMIPGEIITVKPGKQWTYGRHPYLSGEVQGHRLDVEALNLEALELRDPWPWDPTDEYWGEDDEPLEPWAEAIIARGPRTSWEMEQILPGDDPMNFDDGPILRSVDLERAGDHAGAKKLLVELLAQDLRCLDAHAHLGGLAFDHFPTEALRHYELGVRIGELTLGSDFEDVLPWGRIDNRPLMRCLHGFGLCLWRLGRREEAEAVFERMLWLNPMDNQGARFLVAQIRAGEAWEIRYGDR